MPSGRQGAAVDFIDARNRGSPVFVSAVEKSALIASDVNTSTENIGARRLHTVMTKILEELLFTAPNVSEKQIKITDEYVDAKLKDIVSDVDMSRYIL